MDGDTQGSPLAPVRTPGSHLSLGRSRLIERGMEVIDAPKVSLEVHDLIVFEDSVFVLTPDWDAHRTITKPVWNRTETWKRHRRLVLFEFHRSGAFLRKITMPLIEFSTEGYAEATERQPGAITIRSTFIHFCESFKMPRDGFRDLQDPVERLLRRNWVNVRVDYLFSRDGERRAVWSDGTWADGSRDPGESRVPTSWWLRPEWASATQLLGLEETYDSLQTYWYELGARVKRKPFLEPSGWSIVSQDVEAWVDLYQNFYAEVDAELDPMGHEMHEFHATNFPSFRGSSWKSPAFWQSQTRHDPNALWFFEAYPEVNESMKTLLWKLDMTVGTPRIMSYLLPHPYDLIHQGTIELRKIFDEEGEPLEEEGDPWIPTSADYENLKEAYVEAVEDEFLSPEWDGQYDSLYSWGDDLIITFGVDIWDSNAHLLCKVEQDAIQPIKLTDAGFADVYKLVKAHKIAPHSNQYSPRSAGDLSWHYAKARFASGLLYSVATVQWRDLEMKYDIVIVKDVHSDSVSWFRPEVPATDLNDVHVPRWDSYTKL